MMKALSEHFALYIKICGHRRIIDADHLISLPDNIIAHGADILVLQVIAMPDLFSRNSYSLAQLPVFHKPLIYIEIAPEAAAAGPVKGLSAF